MKHLYTNIKKITSLIIKFLGLFTLLMLVLSFSNIPYYAYYQLSGRDYQLNNPPNYIIVMGGSGMPSPDGLIRLYYANIAAKKFLKSKLILALPKNEDSTNTQLQLMADVLIKENINSNRISFEPNGFNTYSQVLEISKMIDSSANLLIITSPEHMMRCILTFKKAGFRHLGALPTFESPSDEKELLDYSIKKDFRIKNVNLRYNMWSYLQYEIKVIREYTAISYYWIKGYI